MSFNNALARAGLRYLDERVKVDSEMARLLLNPAAVEHVEREFGYVYDGVLRSFVSAVDGKPVSIANTTLAEFLRETAKKTTLADLEKM